MLIVDAPVNIGSALVNVAYAPIKVGHALVKVRRALVNVGHAPVIVVCAPANIAYAPISRNAMPELTGKSPSTFETKINLSKACCARGCEQEIRMLPR